MNTLRNDTEVGTIQLTVTVEESDYAAEVEATLRKYRRSVNMPGFRPGMVPMGMIKKMYGQAAKADAVNHNLQQAVSDFIRDNKIEAIGEPLPIDEEEKKVDFANDTTFEFKFEIGVAPAYEPTFDKSDNLKLYRIKVTDEMIDNQVNNYAGRYGNYTEVEEAHGKDMIKGSMTELDAEGNPKEGGIHVDETTMAADYIKDDEQKQLLEGAHKGTTVRFNPKKAYQSDIELSSMLHISKEQAAGMDSDFNLEIKSITHFEPAEINQSLFDKVFGRGQVTSEEEFRAKVAKGISSNFDDESNYRLGIDARELALSKMTDLKYPEAFIRRLLMVTNEKMTQERVEQDFPDMLNDLKWYTFRSRVAAAHNIQPSVDDIREFADHTARMQFAQYGMTEVPNEILDPYIEDMLTKDETVQNINEKVIEDKVVEIMRNAVTVTETEVSVEDFNKLFDNIR